MRLRFETQIFILIFLFSGLAKQAQAALALPTALTREDRQIALKILGFGTQAKLFSSPVPLGGYEGFEFGLASEYLLTEDIAKIGSKTPGQAVKEFNYLTLSATKGLTYNLDTSVFFTPQPQSEGISSFGGHLRWGFYEFQNFPALFSLILHASGSNFSSLLNTRTSGADLVVTVAVSEASLYFGGGPIRTIGTFVGGTQGITSEGKTVDEDLSDLHTVFGLHVKLSSLFVAFEVNRVVQSSYGARLGWRF